MKLPCSLAGRLLWIRSRKMRVALVGAALIATVSNDLHAQIGFVQVQEQTGFTALQREFPDLPKGRSLTLLVVEVNPQNLNGAWAVPRGEELANKQVTYLPPSR